MVLVVQQESLGRAGEDRLDDAYPTGAGRLGEAYGRDQSQLGDGKEVEK